MDSVYSQIYGRQPTAPTLPLNPHQPPSTSLIPPYPPVPLTPHPVHISLQVPAVGAEGLRLSRRGTLTHVLAGRTTPWREGAELVRTGRRCTPPAHGSCPLSLRDLL